MRLRKGPYVPHDPRLPVHGLGDQELPQVGFADEVLLELAGGQLLGSYLRWAEQVSDVTWRESPPEWLYRCVPISDALLDQVKAASGGHEVIWVGILFRKPATLNAIERALFGTPYALSSSQAVHPASYRGSVPPIRFLVWARLRDSMAGSDGGGGGSRSIERAALQLGGRLVYVERAAIPDAVRRPEVPFQEALDAQLGLATQPPDWMYQGVRYSAPVGADQMFTPAVMPPEGQEELYTPAVMPPEGQEELYAPAVMPPQEDPAATAEPLVVSAEVQTRASTSTLPWVLFGGAAAAVLVWWWKSRQSSAARTAAGAGG